MRKMDELFKLFNEKENKALLKCKLDYIGKLYHGCRNAQEYSTIREIVENFCEIIFLLEKEKGTSNMVDSQAEPEDAPHFPSLEKLLQSQPMNDEDILAALDDYMTADALLNHHRQPSELTIKDYIKRLRRYAREYRDGITIMELYENIESHVNNYFQDQENLERNKNQHGAELSALKKLNEMKTYIEHQHRKEEHRKTMASYIHENLVLEDTHEGAEIKSDFDFSLLQGKPLFTRYVTPEQKRACSAHMKMKEETFSQLFLEYIERYRKEHPTECKTDIKLCENVLHISREHYYDIKKMRKSYHPSKITVFTIAIGLGLTLEETNELMLAAGYQISHSIDLDLALEYCISEGLSYDDVYEILEEEGLPGLGKGYSDAIPRDERESTIVRE